MSTPIKTYVVVSLSVVAHEGEPPEVVGGAREHQDVSVVQLVVVAHPGSDESPEGLYLGVSSKSSDLLWLSL